MANGPPPPARSGLSLYANLLGSKSSIPGSITSAPVSYRQAENAEDDEASKKQQAIPAALRFQPVKRPQPTSTAAAAAKAKAKTIASKLSSTTQPPPPPPDSKPSEHFAAQIQPVAPKTTIDDWTATADDDDWFLGEKRQRGGRKKRKKNKGPELIEQNWDDIYDPSRPNSYEQYKGSEEKIMEVREWKDLLYRHRIRRRKSSDYSSEADSRPTMNRQFAPPQAFAPPSNINDESSAPPPPPTDVPDDATGDDAYARRMRMSQGVPPPPPPPIDLAVDTTGEDSYTGNPRSSHLALAPLPPPPPPSDHTLSMGEISRAPVRYSLPEAPPELPTTEAELKEQLATEEEPNDDQSRTNRPGQAGFAERLMSKYGWSKGQGLGAKGTGIVNPLYAKADKRKKRSDAEGGGFATPAGTGKILGGNRAKGVEADEQGKFGPMSEVIRLEHMLDGMDVDQELSRGEGGIMQEIGEECGEKYGTVERVFIHRRLAGAGGAMVFVCFVSQLSALRAVNALDGRVFGGNAISARFWDRDRFEKDDFE